MKYLKDNWIRLLASLILIVAMCLGSKFALYFLVTTSVIGREIQAYILNRSKK